jgi:hypothetical protein
MNKDTLFCNHCNIEIPDENLEAVYDEEWDRWYCNEECYKDMIAGWESHCEMLREGR